MGLCTKVMVVVIVTGACAGEGVCIIIYISLLRVHRYVLSF